MAWQYRSQPYGSYDSAASSKSYGPVSSGRIHLSHTSVDSAVTEDGFEDHGRTLSNLIQDLRSLHPYEEDKTESATAQKDAASAPPQVTGTTMAAVAQDAAPVELVTSPAMTAPAVQAACWMGQDGILYQPVMFPVWNPDTVVASAQPMVYEIDPPAATQGVTKQNGCTAKKQEGGRTLPHNSKGKGKGKASSTKASASRPNRTRTTTTTPIPYATEETWKDRIETREGGLETVKTSESYTMNQDITQYPAFGASVRPLSPNPRDTTLSKRKWEKQLSGGRITWRRIHGVRQLVCKHGFSEDAAVEAWLQADDEKKDMDDSLDEALCILREKPLIDMGFGQEAARKALKQANNDVGKAVQILIGQ